jgi:hypothetical protein
MTVRTFRLLAKPFYLQSGRHDVLLRFSTLWQAFSRLKGVEDSSTFSSGLDCVTHMTYFLLIAFVRAAQAGKLAYNRTKIRHIGDAGTGLARVTARGSRMIVANSRRLAANMLCRPPVTHGVTNGGPRSCLVSLQHLSGARLHGARNLSDERTNLLGNWGPRSPKTW